MRRDDVDGANCRSFAVWSTLAKDFVLEPLKRGERSHTDLVSVVVMKQKSFVVLRAEPCTMFLYNRLLELREWVPTRQRPSNEGYYMPALSQAENLLQSISHDGLSLSVLFYSDGKPSDHGNFDGKISRLARQYGRRLSALFVGFATQNEDFSALESMAKSARDQEQWRLSAWQS